MSVLLYMVDKDKCLIRLLLLKKKHIQRLYKHIIQQYNFATFSFCISTAFLPHNTTIALLKTICFIASVQHVYIYYYIKYVLHTEIYATIYTNISVYLYILCLTKHTRSSEAFPCPKKVPSSKSEKKTIRTLPHTYKKQ